jgi:hypothetical protein
MSRGCVDKGLPDFTGAATLGPRIGRFGTRSESISGHSTPLMALGGFILVFGFMAFNGGSRVSTWVHTDNLPRSHRLLVGRAVIRNSFRHKDLMDLSIDHGRLDKLGCGANWKK